MANADDVLKLLEQRHGIFLKKDFYNAWYQSQSHFGSAPPNLERLYAGVFKHFLNSDMAACTEPFLHRKGIQQTMVLQLQHTTDTSSSLYYLTDALDNNGSISRGYLKWIMTDGDRDIVVFELDKIPSMNLKTPFGSKVQITSGLYACGTLFVKPENFQLLGGDIPELYGDTMENELLRRYTRQLQIQSSTEAQQTTLTTPRTTTISIPAPAPQMNARPSTATTIATAASIPNWTNSNNNGRLTPQATSNAHPPQPTTNDDDFDEFDYWSTDDFSDFDQLERQATASLVASAASASLSTSITSAEAANKSIHTTHNSHFTQNSNGSNHSTAADDRISQWPTTPTANHSSSSSSSSSSLTNNATNNTQKRRPTLSLSTKSKVSANTKPSPAPAPAPVKSTTRLSPPPPPSTYIDLDDTLSPPFRPSKPSNTQQPTVSNFGCVMLDDSQWIDDTSSEHGNKNTTDQVEAPGILSVSELRTLLKAVDNNSFKGNFDRVSVQIQGCLITFMKPLANEGGLYLVAKLLENYSEEEQIVVKFMYFGINSLYEGYTLDQVWKMKKTQGLEAVRKKVFFPLQKRLKELQAIIEIDLTLTEMKSPGSMVRSCTKFTPVPSL